VDTLEPAQTPAIGGMGSELASAWAAPYRQVRTRRAAAVSFSPSGRGVLGTLIRTEGRMASKLKIRVNGLVHNVTASLDTPLLYVLHNELHLHGPRFGCGLAQCGACSVLLDGKEIRSCVTPVAAVTGKAITTLEGMGALYSKSRGTTGTTPAALHPLQQAWIDFQVPACGYCQNGMMIQAADLLSTVKRPTAPQIRTALNGHLCRCGTYNQILQAVKRAAAVMAKEAKS
jgi:aerobic-type carbon monoxide dehydrogenase small subunit (CoxS/CutS family)